MKNIKYVNKIRKSIHISVMTSVVSCAVMFSNVQSAYATKQHLLSAWGETEVRKVLRVFSYGSHASDERIQYWASLPPEDAIKEILTFSPYELYDLLNLDGSFNYDKYGDDYAWIQASSLSNFQNHLSIADTYTSVHSRNRSQFDPLRVRASDQFNLVNAESFKRSWTAATTYSGVNPFLHKITMFLTNYQMAIRISQATPGLFKSYYDQVMSDLVSNKPFTEVIANGSKSAAVARRYGHYNNTFNNFTGVFRGNDDFAREYFQLFFRIDGVDDLEYHENVSIENNAKLLTGMNIDKVENAYGADEPNHWWVAPINFTNHIDGTGRNLRNVDRHHADCLEVLHQQVCGVTASEKIDALSVIASQHEEAMNNLPVYIVNVLADDDITSQEKLISEFKRGIVRLIWQESEDNLLQFLREYAISYAFHSTSTYKNQTAHDRVLSTYNAVNLDNQETFTHKFKNTTGLTGQMDGQGFNVHLPSHDVFGGQTGEEAVSSMFVFKKVHDDAISSFSTRHTAFQRRYYKNEGDTIYNLWIKDWSKAAPKNTQDETTAGMMAEWLWQRMIADGGKHYDLLAHIQLVSILVNGVAFEDYLQENQLVDYDYTQEGISEEDIENNPGLVALIHELSDSVLHLQDAVQFNHDTNGDGVIDDAEAIIESSEADWNQAATSRKVAMAISFISTLPYNFIVEGK